jgi:hypothetical protein
MNDAAVSCARVLSQGLLLFQEKNFLSLLRQSASNVTSDDATADHGNFHERFLSRSNINGSL